MVNPERTSRPYRPAFALAVSGAAAFATLNAAGALPADLQPGPDAKADLRLVGHRSQDFSLWRARSRRGFRAKTRPASGVFAVLFICEGRVRLLDRGVWSEVATGQAVLLALDETIRMEASGPFEALGGTIARHALAAACGTLADAAPTDIPAFQPIVAMAGWRLRAIEAAVRSMRRHLMTRDVRYDSVLPLMQELLIFQILSCWPTADSATQGGRNASKAQARQALDFIEANLTKHLTIADIATECGLSSRALHATFKRQFGRSPMQFVMDQRYAGAHRDLRTADANASVSQIAFRWGFTHMSDFAREYRRRYGCAPRDTMRS